MRLSAKLLITIFLLWLMVSCKQQETPVQLDMPEVGISSDIMNTRVLLTTPSSVNTFQVNDGIYVYVNNISTDQVIFKYDFGNRIFIYKDNEWIEVKDITENPEGYEILSPSGGNAFKFGSISVMPIIQNIKNEPILVRIILIGNIYKDGTITDEIVASYIDVNLHR